jgi:hypothetical protein
LGKNASGHEDHVSGYDQVLAQDRSPVAHAIADAQQGAQLPACFLALPGNSKKVSQRPLAQKQSACAAPTEPPSPGRPPRHEKKPAIVPAICRKIRDLNIIGASHIPHIRTKSDVQIVSTVQPVAVPAQPVFHKALADQFPDCVASAQDALAGVFRQV